MPEIPPIQPEWEPTPGAVDPVPSAEFLEALQSIGADSSIQEIQWDIEPTVSWDPNGPTVPLAAEGSLFHPDMQLPAPLTWVAGSPDQFGSYGYMKLLHTGELSEFKAAWAALGDLIRNYDVKVGQYTFDRYTDVDTGQRWRLPNAVLVQRAGLELYGSLYQFDETGCYECGDAIPIGSPECPSCRASQFCFSCNIFTGTQLIDDPDDDEGGPLCAGCSRNCEAISPVTGRPCGVPSAFVRCIGHAQGRRYNCVNCGQYTDDGHGCEFSDYFDGIVCSNCRPSYCDRCDREVGFLHNGLCEDCEMSAVHADHGTETFEPEEKLERDMFIEAIPGRENIRRCGLEIEGGGNWRTMGQRLFDAGLTVRAGMGDYHEATSIGFDRWSLERDGSVDWELVSPPINLADRDHVRSLRGVLKIVREEIKSEAVSLDMRCGLHIHVGAERTAIGGAFNLGTVWGYLEDVIFRLGAAKWPKHRAIVNGLHYCRPTPKGAKTRLEFGLQMENASEPRYNALSFNNYIRAMSRGCTCGAVRYDSWDQCVCDLGKCTFEFRVFNASANMHKIHAYLALCQALVAWSTALPDLDVNLFPEQTFVPKLVAEMGEVPRTQIIEDWKPRLQFIFNELPLTDPEKADLLYCVRSSELDALGEDFIKELAPNNAQEVLI